MATLFEYFTKDGAANLTTHQTWPFTNKITGEKVGEIIARLHFDFDAYATYISFYFPAMHGLECPEAMALNEVAAILKWPQETVVQMGFGAELTDGRELRFTGQIYLYSERPLPIELKDKLAKEARATGHHLTFRSIEYMEERNKWEKPKAFISHDSRDKKEIAEPIALQLQKWMSPVWFDQYSLKVGDSLREGIETGLRDCPKCILILTPNFLNNNGWTKREYDSVFTRELVEKKKVILPVWHNISVEDVYKYSPILADRVGVQWADGVEQVARKLLIAIDAKDNKHP
jgi:TIR domain